MTFKRFAVQLLWWFAPLIGWIFAYMSFAIPVRRLRETESLMAFHHPKPSYPFHVILLPKKSVKSLMDFDPKESAFLTDLYFTVQSLVEEFHLTAYRLIVNGGEYQDFPQLHFHLVSPHPDSSPIGRGMSEGQGEGT